MPSVGQKRWTMAGDPPKLEEWDGTAWIPAVRHMGHQTQTCKEVEAERDQLRTRLAQRGEALVKALPVLEYVSRGGGYVRDHGAYYPDAQARKALAAAHEVLRAVGNADSTTEAT